MNPFPDILSAPTVPLSRFLTDDTVRLRDLYSRGCARSERFRQSRDIADLTEAISHYGALAMTNNGTKSSDYNLRVLSGLGSALIMRFGRIVADLTPDDHADKPGRLNTLASVLLTRSQWVGSLADIEEAVSTQQKAVGLTQAGDPKKPRRLDILGTLFRLRFERLDDLEDIENSVSNHQQAVELTPEDRPYKPDLYRRLGISLQIRFKRLGHLADIDRAISYLQKGVELMPDSHPNKPRHFNDLGNSIQIRFQHLGSLADIDDAVTSLQRAVELTPDGHKEQPWRLNNLGNSLQIRFDRLGNLADIHNAISNLQKAVEIMPGGHLDKPALYSNLGAALQARFTRLGGRVDIDNAMSHMEKALELTPDGDPDEPGRLNNFGNTLQARFQRLGSPEDLENAISSLGKAVELTSDGHPDNPRRLHNLGTSLSYSTAARSSSGPAMVRFNAARSWANTSLNNLRSPLTAFSCAIELLPRIAWVGIPMSDQHELLALIGDVVRDAVAAAIQSGSFETAVEWAEQGRSIVWQNLLGLRTPLDDLRTAHPQLADRLQSIARQLETTSSPDVAVDEPGFIPSKQIARQYSEWATEWEGIIGEIRKMPGLEEFLKPKRFATLAPAAYEGPVVILNVHQSRCDALLLRSEDKHVSVTHVPLEGFPYETSQKLFRTLTTLLSSAGVRDRSTRKHEWVEPEVIGEAKLKAILRTLWTHVVKPIMKHLGYQAKTESHPRIWWCATGFLSFLPIHAAGLYGTEEMENVSDYVISSYTPTLTAILDEAKPMVQGDFQLLTVAQPSTPYATAIPKTGDEVKLVRSIASGVRVVNLSSEDATVTRVVEFMKESSWIHLACHGQQDANDPMKSGFLLHDRILELANIVKLTLPKADFAFLSACQTATGDEKVVEESVHLAAGMLLSGCRGVIATMWSIRDGDAPQIAGDVYSRILKGGWPNRKQAAHALHEAVKRLRNSGADFMAWVPFIHIGR